MTATVVQSELAKSYIAQARIASRLTQGPGHEGLRWQEDAFELGWPGMTWAGRWKTAGAPA